VPSDFTGVFKSVVRFVLAPVEYDFGIVVLNGLTSSSMVYFADTFTCNSAFNFCDLIQAEMYNL